MRAPQHFQPDSQGTARFSSQPFQRFETNIGGVDRTEPELFPTIEGEFLYCERADYPVLINLVLPGKGIQISQVFRTGTQIKAPFKGLSISHPLLSAVFGAKLNVAFLVGKQKDVDISNNLGDACAPMIPAWRQITNSATIQQYNVFIPPGVRRIRKIAFSFGATTVTSSGATFSDNAGSLITQISTISQQIGASVVTYNGSNQPGSSLKVSSTAVTGTFIAEGSDIFVPSNAVEVALFIFGTGLVAPSIIECVFT